MKPLVLLDTGPLGMITHPKAAQNRPAALWLRELLSKTIAVRVPMIADYELRRELLRAERSQSVARLDALENSLGIIDISRAMLRCASQLWADARKQGKPTADDKALDGDVILAAQARALQAEGWTVIVATTNVGHLARFVTAMDWESIDANDFGAG